MKTTIEYGNGIHEFIFTATDCTYACTVNGKRFEQREKLSHKAALNILDEMQASFVSWLPKKSV